MKRNTFIAVLLAALFFLLPGLVSAQATFRVNRAFSDQGEPLIVQHDVISVTTRWTGTEARIAVNTPPDRCVTGRLNGTETTSGVPVDYQGPCDSVWQNAGPTQATRLTGRIMYSNHPALGVVIDGFAARVGNYVNAAGGAITNSTPRPGQKLITIAGGDNITHWIDSLFPVEHIAVGRGFKFTPRIGVVCGLVGSPGGLFAQFGEGGSRSFTVPIVGDVNVSAPLGGDVTLSFAMPQGLRVSCRETGSIVTDLGNFKSLTITGSGERGKTWIWSTYATGVSGAFSLPVQVKPIREVSPAPVTGYFRLNGEAQALTTAFDRVYDQFIPFTGRIEIRNTADGCVGAKVQTKNAIEVFNGTTPNPCEVSTVRFLLGGIDFTGSLDQLNPFSLDGQELVRNPVPAVINPTPPARCSDAQRAAFSEWAIYTLDAGGKCAQVEGVGDDPGKVTVTPNGVNLRIIAYAQPGQ